MLTARRAATQSIIAGGDLNIAAEGASGVAGGLGASLTLQGASVSVASNIMLPSGLLTVRATNGDVSIGGRVNLNGTAASFYDLTRYTSGGQVQLISDTGSVSIGADSVISLSAHPGGGNAGSLLVSAANGAFINAGEFVGRKGAGGKGGAFSLDALTLPGFGALQAELESGGFSESQSFRVRTGNVALDGMVKVNHFRVSTDLGSITVSGTIDASGVRGGSIALASGGNLVLENGSRLTVAAEQFDAAGKGGAISLETTGVGTTVDIQAGSAIDLSVAENNASSAAFGKFTGTLHLRARQNSTGTDLGINTIGGNITGASAIIVEGYKIYNLAGQGIIDKPLQDLVKLDGEHFLGVNGSPATNTYSAMLARILGSNTALDPVLTIRHGAEIVSTGNLQLGTASSSYTSDWNLSNYRFGPKGAAGVLTLRAAGNITFYNTISDGFQTADWDSPLLQQNTALPVNSQSWDYRFTAGADLAAADFSQVRSLPSLAANSGSIILGKDDTRNGVYITPGTPGATTYNAIDGSNYYQVIRTGSGNISISAGRDLQFRNPFASIFTVGTQVLDATVLPNGGSFVVPDSRTLAQGTALSNLGPNQRENGSHAVQYTMAGGNVSIAAQNDIARFRKVGQNLIADSVREMPNNWLYRRGMIDPDSGMFDVGVSGTIDSTTWWVDFSNFFQGVGSLGWRQRSPHCRTRRCQRRRRGGDQCADGHRFSRSERTRRTWWRRCGHPCRTRHRRRRLLCRTRQWYPERGWIDQNQQHPHAHPWQPDPEQHRRTRRIMAADDTLSRQGKLRCLGAG
jgi:hypothetical protein